MALAKRPAFQFYPSDWVSDPALKSCSLAARGLWIDMLCIAHASEPYGHLTVNGKPMTAAQLARMVGAHERECARLLTELEDAGVLSRTDAGIAYSRRMVRDEEFRKLRAEHGAKGAEHGVKGAEHGAKGGRPKRTKGGSETPLNHDGRGVSKPPLSPPIYPPPSSSSSSSEENQESIASQLSVSTPDANRPDSVVGSEKPKAARKEPTGPHAEARRSFCDRWSEKYGAKYPFAFGGKDDAALKWILSQIENDGVRFAEILGRFFADDDLFYAAEDRHSLAKLRQHFARWLVEAPLPEKSRTKSRGQLSEEYAIGVLLSALPSFSEDTADGLEPRSSPPALPPSRGYGDPVG